MNEKTFYIFGIIIGLVLGLMCIIYIVYKSFKKEEKKLEMHETHFSKIVVKNFSSWLITFALFTALVLLIFSTSMLIVS